MIKLTWMAGLVVGLAISVSMCGCEGGGSGDDDAPPVITNIPPVVVNAHVAGVWHGARHNTNGSATATLTLTQSGGSLGGNYSDSSLFAGPVSGSINGDKIDIVVTMTATPAPHPTGETWTIKGSVNDAEDQINATMKDVADSLKFSLDLTK
jgi:hypothetical protein